MSKYWNENRSDEQKEKDKVLQDWDNKKEGKTKSFLHKISCK